MAILKIRIPLVLGLAAALMVAGVAAPALAQGAGSLEARTAKAGLGSLFKASIRAAAPEDIRVTKLDNGLTKMVVPVAKSGNDDEFITRAQGPLLLMVLVHEILEPDLIAETVSFDFAPIADFPYFYGWVVLNRGADANKKTTVIRKGPGDDVRLVETLTYDGGAFILFFFESSAAEGIHKYSVKVTSGGAKLKANMDSGGAG